MSCMCLLQGTLEEQKRQCEVWYYPTCIYMYMYIHLYNYDSISCMTVSNHLHVHVLYMYIYNVHVHGIIEMQACAL